MTSLIPGNRGVILETWWMCLPAEHTALDTSTAHEGDARRTPVCGAMLTAFSPAVTNLNNPPALSRPNIFICSYHPCNYYVVAIRDDARLSKEGQSEAEPASSVAHTSVNTASPGNLYHAITPVITTASE